MKLIGTKNIPEAFATALILNSTEISISDSTRYKDLGELVMQAATNACQS